MDERRPPAEASQSVRLDIDATWLEHSIKNRADMSVRGRPPSEPTIFRVPPSLRCGDLRAYMPKLVSIGPYHRGNSDLKAMEELKWRILHDYLSKLPKGSMNEGVTRIRDLEQLVRNCYSEVIYLDSDQFVEMLLLDGCFLVQIFMFSDKNPRSEAGSLLSDDTAKELISLLCDNMWFRNLIFRDLLLLENQLPYFIVEHLLDTLMLSGSIFQEVAISRFLGFLPKNLEVGKPVRRDQSSEVIHLLHLFHEWILNVPRSEEESNTKCCDKLEQLRSALSLMVNKIGDRLCKVLPCCCHEGRQVDSQSIPTVTELVEAGVNIKVMNAESFLHISFCKDKGVLKIPAICVDDYTNFLFANLIALEQCCPKYGSDATHYTMFLDDIINTPMDVQSLHQEGIIHRDLGSNEDIASLFNKLGNGVTYDSNKNYLSEVREGLNDYCQARWPRWRAKAVRDYFSNPWAFISLVAAVVLLGLTILQSVYAILGYYK